MSSSAILRPLAIKPVQLILALAIMASAVTGAAMMKPSKYWADELGDTRYDSILPDTFGDWVHVPDRAAAVVNPQQSEMLDKIYSETVSRLYFNRRLGRAIMLAVAYGRDQSTDTQLHTPDMCYPSQGFSIQSTQSHVLKTPWGQLPTVRLKTAMGQRVEPLTYFIRTGDRVTTQGSLDRNLARLAMAVKGYRIDGLLVRVSEVTNSEDTYTLQDQFLVELISATTPGNRSKLIGSMADSKGLGVADASQRSQPLP